uniref:Putative secreted peptide n=1 Tax=Anopheles braziliensis TaxID=58242 RepID=A0A2M3ZR02_9DIPT
MTLLRNSLVTLLPLLLPATLHYSLYIRKQKPYIISNEIVTGQNGDRLLLHHRGSRIFIFLYIQNDISFF